MAGSSFEFDQNGELMPTWLYESFYPSTLSDIPQPKWKPFWEADCEALENSFKNKLRKEIYVLGGKYIVNFERRNIRAVYWDEIPKERPVIRGTWFRESNQFIEPYSEFDAEKIETLYQEISQNYKDEGSVQVTEGYVSIKQPTIAEREAIIRKNIKNSTLRKENCELLMNEKIGEKFFENCKDHSLDSDTKVYRMYGPHSIKEEDELGQSKSLPIDRVVFFIHGIGEAFWSSFNTNMEGFKDIAYKFESNLMKQRMKEAAKNHSEIAGRFIVIPIFWFKRVQDKKHAHIEELEAISFISNLTKKQLRNEIIMDVLFYSTPKFLEDILEEVGIKMNNAWKILKRLNPNLSDECVSIIGHSLGSVIGFDLLQGQNENSIGECSFDLGPNYQHLKIKVPKLGFRPLLFIGCGSPLGMFLVKRGDKKDKSYNLPTCKHFINVFHPHDVVAFRIEPKLDKRFAKIKPEIVSKVEEKKFENRFQSAARNLAGLFTYNYNPSYSNVLMPFEFV